MMIIIEKPKIPSNKSAILWDYLCPTFANIFDDCHIDPLIPFLGETSPKRSLYVYFISKQYNRIVLPEMTPDDDVNKSIITSIKELLGIRSYSLKYKYEMLASTMPDNIDELYKNYNIHREYTDKKTIETGTVKNSGTDISYNNVDVQTEEFSTTGDSQTPRLKYKSERKTIPNEVNNSHNSMQTSYGRVITSTPGDETRTFEQDANGYYGGTSKAKLINDIRNLLTLDIVDEWLNDVMPLFMTEVYEPKTPFQLLGSL